MKRLSRIVCVGVLAAAALSVGVDSAMAASSTTSGVSHYGGKPRRCDAEYTAAYYHAIQEGWGDLLAREYADMVYEGCG
ncbi:hypothetical protein ACWGR4_33115 [Embleya sp. NPDC055664]|uniref:hypothetical protein n=1 Tax=Embleya sp. NPDC020630 TaxID=3363979 RepID=UPI0037BADFB9